MPDTQPYHEIAISGMHCTSCVAGIEAALYKIPGVQKASVNFVESKGLVVGDVNEADIIAAVESEGYEATVLSADNEETAQTELDTKLFHTLLRRCLVAGVVGFSLMAASWLKLLPEIKSMTDQLIWGGLSVLTLAVMWYSGHTFYGGAWASFKRFRANMDTLIGMGTGTAWLYSTLIVLVPNSVPSLARHAYFESALIILSLINLGQALEQRAKGKTSEAIKRLAHLQPKTARVIRDGEDLDIPIHQVQMNDLVRVRPGEHIAVDGIITEGHSFVDESMISGESVPVVKKVEDEVIGGTLNKTGSFIFKATHVGKETALAQIIELVKQAQSSKPPIGRMVDKVASVFVPIVLSIALIAATVWLSIGPEPQLAYALVIVMSVLLIACPCALGLATPISTMVGIGNAAEHGILIRNGEALQRASQLTTVVMDKTGTITQGRPSLQDITTKDDWSEEQILKYAASAEINSEHPLAEAIVAKAKDTLINLSPAENFEAIPGHGLVAQVEQKRVLLGNSKLMKRFNCSPGILEATFQQIAEQGQTPMYIAIDDEVVGVITVADLIKEDAKMAIDRLKQRGIKVIMITGDHQATANKVAQQVGIDSVLAEVLPADKENEIARLQNEGEIVGMVGDGINDAPALTRADVGFAIGTGTNVAIASADVTLVGGSLNSVTASITVSRATLQNIRQNLLGAFLYNSLALPIAAGVLYPWTGWLLSPMIAGGAMALSSLTVVMNALRLKWK